MGVRSRARGSLVADERALLDGLVRELAPRLLAYVRHVYGNQHDAEDIVAETFCRAASNIAALSESSRRDLYVLTIARNLCRDRFRKHQPESMPAERLSERPGCVAEPEVVVGQNEQRRALREAVAGLPDNLREVVVLRLSSGLKFEQIAELLHIPLGTALSRMHTAVGRLRKTLDATHER